MNIQLRRGIFRFVMLCLGCCSGSYGADRYVSTNSPTPLAPYMTWTSAAHTIQEAIDVSSPGDTVWVTNGVYNTGGTTVNGGISNRVAITNSLAVRSVNGPAVTIIEGEGVVGDQFVRGVYIGDNSSLQGFTVTKGATEAIEYARTSRGGGVYSTSLGIVSNCWILGNTAYSDGGGVFGGNVYHSRIGDNFCYVRGGGIAYAYAEGCAMYDNIALSGGGLYGGTGRHCNVLFNQSLLGGGGVGYASVESSIVLYNEALHDGNNYYALVSINSSCTYPLAGGTGNIANEPALRSLFHISQDSPCVGMGDAAHATLPDIDGEVWSDPPSIGADEPNPDSTGPLFVELGVDYDHVAVDFDLRFLNLTTGPTVSNTLDFGDGRVVTNVVQTSHRWSMPGEYDVVLTVWNASNPMGVSVTSLVSVSKQEIYYVDAASAEALPPFSSWSTAATNIQDAIEASDQAGRLVLVTNGIYASGTRPNRLAASSRIYLDQAVIVRSQNGPFMTTIQGQGPNGPEAVRGAWVEEHCVLEGFSLSGGSTLAEQYTPWWLAGGGLMCMPQGKVVRCIIENNTSAQSGGGVGIGVLESCVVRKNQAQFSAGSVIAKMTHCTITENEATLAVGGTMYGRQYNCINFGNESPSLPNSYRLSEFLYGCTFPDLFQPYSISEDPRLLDAMHISEDSPCVSRGSSLYTLATDIDGDARRDPPAMGADEPYSASTGPLNIRVEASHVHVAQNFAVTLKAITTGILTRSSFDFGDGVLVSNRDSVVHSWSETGLYAVVYTAWNGELPNGLSTTVHVDVATMPVQYVNVANPAPVSPYLNWQDAATNIQDAVDAGTLPGRIVLVTNGIYNTGSRIVYGSMKNRIVLTDGVQVQSVNGPDVTIIEGVGPIGDASVRGTYVSEYTSLSGFTVRGGATRNAGDEFEEQSGGGIYCEYRGAVRNCIISENEANMRGGGMSGGVAVDSVICSNAVLTYPCFGGGVQGATLQRCSVFKNSSAYSGGGVSGGTLYDCIVTENHADSRGGGLDSCTAYRTQCISNSALSGGGGDDSRIYYSEIRDNSAAQNGGGTYASQLSSCLLSGNSANRGGGSYRDTLRNCTVINNSAIDSGGGMYQGDLENSIVYYNQCVVNSNHTDATASYSCAAPLLLGESNIANTPGFVGGESLSDLQLDWRSACINAGDNAGAVGQFDLRNMPRIIGSIVDMGAYESTNGVTVNAVAWGWLLDNDFATDGSDDLIDTDADRMINAHEYYTGTYPRNDQSYLGIWITNGATGAHLSWPSAVGRTYNLQISTNLVDGEFECLLTNLPATPPMNVVTDQTLQAVGVATNTIYRVQLNSYPSLPPN